MAEGGGAPETGSSRAGTLSLRGAIFIGIGAMVGAGIFALFGEAGTIAGAAVWVSFLIGGDHRSPAGLFVRQAGRPLSIQREG